MKLVATYPNTTRTDIIRNVSESIATMALQYMPMELDDLADMFADTLLLGNELYNLKEGETLHLIIKSDSLAMFSLKANAEHHLARCKEYGETPTMCVITCEDVPEPYKYSMDVFE